MSVREGHSYRVALRVGDLEWDITKGDGADYGPVAGLSVSWSFPDDGLFPTAPEPPRADFALIAQQATDLLDHIDIGTVVHIRVYLGVDDGAPTFTPLPSVQFTGRVAQMEGSNVKLGPGQLAYMLQLACVDKVADLSELEVAGTMPFQGVGVQAWVERLFANAGLPAPDWGFGGWGQATLLLNDGKIEPGNLYQTVDALLASYADGGNIIGTEDDPNDHEWYPYEGWRRGYLAANVDPDTGDDLTPAYKLEWFSRRATIAAQSGSDTYPLSVRRHMPGNTWYLAYNNPYPGTVNCRQVISADYLDFDARWKRTKNTAPSAVTIGSNIPADEVSPDPWEQVTLYTTEDRPVVATRIENYLGYMRFNAVFSAEMLLPDPSPYRDTPDGFTYYASDDPSWPLVPSWFPGPHVLWFGHSLPVVLRDIPLELSPAGPASVVDQDTGRYVGTIKGATFTIRPGGTFDFGFQLVPGAPRPGGIPLGYAWDACRVTDIAWTKSNTLADKWTVAATDPLMTAHELRLARRDPDPALIP